MELAAILPHLLSSLTLLFLVQCCLFPSLCDALTNITTDESALLALKSRLSITPSHVVSRNWSVSTPVCTWIGVTCNTRHHRVASLDLFRMHLTGTLAPHIGNLTFLVSLNISGNSFHGSIPHEFAHLRRLKVIDFAFNNFIGSIPLSFGFLTELKYLTLRNNSFSTFLPNSIANMSKLEKLDLSYNPLHGTLPVEIAKLESMKVLWLEFSQLEGVIPKAIFNMSNLESLALTGNSLRGNLPSDICLGLPRLEDLYLSENELDGEIPSNISRCRQLRLLALSINKFGGPIPTGIGELRALEMLHLRANKLTGEVPKELGGLQNLKLIDVGSNLFVGTIPSSLFNISSLQLVLLSENNLTGIIPRRIGNLTMLQIFYVNLNDLTGTIPEEIGYLGNLEQVNLESNSLTGFIPVRIFNMSSLRVISIGMNQLSGNLPSSFGYGLPNLEKLYFNFNNLSGEIPSTISNASKLSFIAFNDNKFGGTIPNFLGDLAFLTGLYMQNNKFVSKSSELTFVTSFANCRFLTKIELGNNPLNATLPVSVGNLSSSLEYFYCYGCSLYGNIPPGFGNLTNLLVLSLYGNQLIGSIPKTLGNLQNIQGLFFYGNMLSGSIPDVLCRLGNLYDLFLDKNQITGSIPNCIGNLTALRKIYIDNNRLNFSIPQSLWQLKYLLELSLPSNFLSGSLPPDIGNLKVATHFDLSRNKLTADIPSTIGEMQNLVNLALAHNGFQGSIPESVGKLVSLEQLDLSHNNLSGGIPKSLETLQYLTYLDVSYNSLSGEIPSGGPFKNLSSQFFASNQGLCGDPRFAVPLCNSVSSHKSKRGKVIHNVVYALLGVVGSIFLLSLAYALLKKYQKKEAIAASGDNLPSGIAPLRASYYDLTRATEGFSEARLLGTGGFSSVYKADLQSGVVVAVKVFNLQLEGAFKSFHQECEVLRSLRHRNLCKVLGSSSNESFKALLLEYMPNGSLDKWIHFENYFLTIVQRIDIMIDVACALEYLHHGYSKPVVHCDLKPSNVLLDENMVARVSDFGIAKLLGEDESFAETNTFATIGYIAPEYGSQGIVSTKCDVYSYGIMLMEVFTRTKPSSETYSQGSINLRSWVNESVPLSVLAIIDPTLLKPEEKYLEQKLECLTSVMELALKCTVESPSDRINMKEVVVLLKKIKAKVNNA